MWLRKPGRETKRWLAALGIARRGRRPPSPLSGCGAAYVEGNTASVLLLIQSIAEGTPQLSDVRGRGRPDRELPDRASRSAVAAEEPEQPPRAYLEDVQLNRYTVTYRRADGRAVEGIDVPFAISGNTSALVVSDGATTTALFVDLVRHQAKLEPPLMNITGVQVVTMFADITVFGTTVSGKAVSAKGSAQVTSPTSPTARNTCEG